VREAPEAKERKIALKEIKVMAKVEKVRAEAEKEKANARAANVGIIMMDQVASMEWPKSFGRWKELRS
jgi:hypothetical protein